MEGKKSRTEQKVKLLERDGREYFNYLERRGDKMYLESPYFEYLINKIDKT